MKIFGQHALSSLVARISSKKSLDADLEKRIRMGQEIIYLIKSKTRTAHLPYFYSVNRIEQHQHVQRKVVPDKNEQ